MAGFTLDVRSNVDFILERLNAFERDQVPFVTAYALSKTAQDIKTQEVQVMARVFDRPTRFTLNALFVKTATKRDLTAAVRFKEGFGSIPAWRYLGPQVEGGRRVKKAHERRLERAGILRPDEYVVPGEGAALDAHGNMRGGIIERILSQLGAAEQLSGYSANETARSRRRNRRKNTGRYFVLRGAKGAPDGVYMRMAGTAIKPVMIFVRPPTYSRRYPYNETARQVYQRNFARHFAEGWRRYVVNGPKARRSVR
jgi:hypothetical protein